MSDPRVTEQSPLSPHPPPVQPLNRELGAATALSETTGPKANLLLQSRPQLMPEGRLWTLPFPVPGRVTVNTGSLLFIAPHTPPSAYKPSPSWSVQSCTTSPLNP